MELTVSPTNPVVATALCHPNRVRPIRMAYP
jgi:hypothetical protein